MSTSRKSGIASLGSSRRVLIVDDQEDGAELVAMLLAALGHEVQIAHDGEAALLMAAEFRPHVALLDLCLPLMDGYQLASSFRASPTLSDCRLIAISGLDLEPARLRAAGFESQLVKPFGRAALVDALMDDPPRPADRLMGFA